jgi:hypothetical protein
MAKRAAITTTGSSGKTSKKGGKKTRSGGTKTATSERRSGGKKPAALEQVAHIPPLTHEQIAQRAHEIWQSRGCPWGDEDKYWFEAEKQLRQELNIG